MKALLNLILVAALASCLGGGGDSTALPNFPSPTASWNTFSVATPSDLPGCSGDIIGRLYFIESTNDFRVCKSTTGWTVVSLTTNPGITVTSIKNISGSSTDYCTQNTGEACYFSGGQILILSDGSYLLTYRFSYNLGITGDTDVDFIAETVFVPASYTVATKAMHPFVARGAGYRTVYITYTKATNSVQVVLDSNNDAIISGADELLFTTTPTTIN